MKQEQLEFIEITKPVFSEKQAVERKLRFLEARILGFPTVNFTVQSNDLVYVPYRAFLFWFEIGHKPLINRTDSKETKGELAFTFDCNEIHPYEYNLDELGPLEIQKIKLADTGGQVLEEACSREEALSKTEFYINKKVLRQLYGTVGELTLLDDFLFYRPARRLQVVYKGSKSINDRFAYMDDYELQNDHIAGLRSRIGGGS